MRARVCVGSYAKNPFWIRELSLRVFSMEELCYVIKENAYMLDEGFMSRELVDWIGEECRLPELAAELKGQLKRKVSLEAFAACIMEYVAFYDYETIRSLEHILRAGAGLSVYEKRAGRLKSMLREGRLMSAYRGYVRLISRMEAEWRNREATSEERGVCSSLWHNEGVCLALMMHYDRAAECFFKAYEQDGSPKSLKAALAARRMKLSEREYVELASSLPEAYGASMELEREMDEAERHFYAGRSFADRQEQAQRIRQCRETCRRELKE